MSWVAKRDALLIPGVLLLVFSFVALGYVEFLRPATATPCEDAARVLYDDVCYQIWKPMMAPIGLGLLLVLLAFVAVRRPPPTVTTAARTGPGTHTTFAVLLALFIASLVGLLYALAIEAGSGIAAIRLRETVWRMDFIFTWATVATGLLLAAFTAFWANHVRLARRRDELEAREAAKTGPIRPADTKPGPAIGAVPLRDARGQPAHITYIDLDDQK